MKHSYTINCIEKNCIYIIFSEISSGACSLNPLTNLKISNQFIYPFLNLQTKDGRVVIFFPNRGKTESLPIINVL